jgi:hypothetical protein
MLQQHWPTLSRDTVYLKKKKNIVLWSGSQGIQNILFEMDLDLKFCWIQIRNASGDILPEILFTI